jgi:hypothetical protein
VTGRVMHRRSLSEEPRTATGIHSARVSIWERGSYLWLGISSSMTDGLEIKRCRGNFDGNRHC